MTNKSKPHRVEPVTKSIIVAQIDKDHLWEVGDPTPSKVGVRWEIPATKVTEMFPDWALWGLTKARFRCLDDDNIVYYGGWLYNDPDCEVQSMVVAWATADSGAPHIQVKNLDNKWVYEIG